MGEKGDAGPAGRDGNIGAPGLPGPPVSIQSTSLIYRQTGRQTDSFI